MVRQQLSVRLSERFHIGLMVQWFRFGKFNGDDVWIGNVHQIGRAVSGLVEWGERRLHVVQCKCERISDGQRAGSADNDRKLEREQ